MDSAGNINLTARQWKDGHWTHRGDHFAKYMNVESLSRTPESHLSTVIWKFFKM